MQEKKDTYIQSSDHDILLYLVRALSYDHIIKLSKDT